MAFDPIGSANIWTELGQRVGTNRLGDISGGETSGTHARVDDSYSAACQLVRSALVKRYDETAVDAISSSTATRDLTECVLSVLLYFLTAHGGGRSQEIVDDYDRAIKWLERATSGDYTLDITLRGSSASASNASGSVRVNAPTELTFDKDNDSQGWYYRDPSI